MPATFIIIREDLQVDPVTIVAEGLLVGRVPTCELLLNHPSVSRLHAGITSVEGDYYIRNLRRGNPIMLNGAQIEEYEALADGDVIGIGRLPCIWNCRVPRRKVNRHRQHIKNPRPENQSRPPRAPKLSMFFGTS